jgi:hypothetical protein
LILTLFFCFTAGPYVVVENYGNWKTLSVDSKSAYITGLWDGYIAFFGKELQEKYSANCINVRITRVSDLVEMVDSLYEEEINRSFSPAFLIREKGLQNICRN